MSTSALSNGSVPATCRENMRYGDFCGRPIHPSPSDVDPTPKCLMHSRDASKSSSAFHEEFERILTQSGVGLADFTGFVFPSASFRERTFEATCDFSQATFVGEADFSLSKFVKDVSFIVTKFKEGANFSQTVFHDGANFSAAEFHNVALYPSAIFKSGDFRKTVFLKKAVFDRAGVVERLSFEDALFKGETVFSELRARGVTQFNKAVFTGTSSFRKAAFEQDADFSKAKFIQSVDIKEARFSQDAKLESTEFKKADFTAATFNGQAYFNNASFREDADFSGVTFSRCGFSETLFEGPACFGTVNFHGPANFYKATFCKDVTFLGAHFHERHVFKATTFEREADLSGVEFHEEVGLYGKTKFFGNVLFAETIFRKEVVFKEISFAREVLFIRARFQAFAYFGEGIFRSDDALEAGPIFELTQISKDGILFDKTNLSRALFHSCDLSNVTFSSVTWPKNQKNGNVMVFDQLIPISEDYTLKRPDGERDYALIAQLYQQLKKNYDAHLDYWTADHFHYGEMEMQRLAVPTSGPFLRLRAIYRHHFGLIAWYRRGSNYGNSYLRSAGWLGVILLLFAFLFPIFGIQRASGNMAALPSPPTTYGTSWPAAAPFHCKVWAELTLFGKSLLVAIDNVTFQKASEYTPTYPYGHVLGIFQSLLTAVVLGLFLLAIRRRFRR